MDRVRTRVRRAGIVLCVVGGLMASAWTAPAQAVSTSSAHRSANQVGNEAWQILRLTNAARARFDRRPLTLDREMSLDAIRHSRAMAQRGELFHTPDVGAYLDGVSWNAWGENVGFTSGDLPGLQRAFMASAPHRTNILNPRFRRAAVGAVRVDGVLWVTVFFYA